MHPVFLILGAITLAGTVAAMTLRNPIHCILALTTGLVGLAGIYLELGAQFVGFTQILVYVGAVAILAVFAIMMTQSGRPAAEGQEPPQLSSYWLVGGLIAVGVFAVLAWAITAGANAQAAVAKPVVSVVQIGDALMHVYVVPLEIVGVLLTAALIGAVIVAMPEKRGTR